MAEVIIEDNGIGFDQRYAEQIFKPFQRLHSREEFPGTGIGLAICHKIVQRHGGMIFAHGNPGKGARFTVVLPQFQPEQHVEVLQHSAERARRKESVRDDTASGSKERSSINDHYLVGRR